MNTIYYIETAQLDQFAHKLTAKYLVLAPQQKPSNVAPKTDYSYKTLGEEDNLVFNPYRAVEPLKTFFTHLKEKVSTYFTPETQEITIKPIVIWGVKSCDIAGHKIQDFVFLEGIEVDTLYRVRRENTILIASDCTDFKEVCFCLAWDILPHPVEGFDLNLSPLNDGYLVEVGSKKGEELVRQYRDFFVAAKDTQIAARKTKRENFIEAFKRHLLPQNLVSKNSVQKLMREGFSADTWQEFMQTCVECGGCNLICDTCHCFLLVDQNEGNHNSRLRLWDSCLYLNYARVAGGANPLKLRAHRLRNRFAKKFDFFVDNIGMPACCGCGRCIEVCPGKIDIREVLKDLASKIK